MPALQGLPATWCAGFSSSMHVSTEGHFRPCSYYLDPVRREDGTAFDTRTSTLLDAWNSADLERIRAGNLAGERNPACTRCWEVEEVGGTSRRHAMNQRPELVGAQPATAGAALRALELNLSNRCNLHCRTCNPEQSSAIAAERAAVAARLAGWLDGADAEARRPLVDAVPQAREFVQLLARPPAAARDLPSVDTDLWLGLEELLPTLDSIDLLGGEPMLVQEHFTLLERCVASGHAKHIDVAFTTNGTVPPRRWVELWQAFRSVSVRVSLDATEARFEYLRHGAKWSRVTEHIQEMLAARREVPGLEVWVNATVNAYNIYYLPELISWSSRVDVPLVLFPVAGMQCYSPRALPPGFKKAVRRRLEDAPIEGTSLRGGVAAALELMDSADWSARCLPTFRLLTALFDEQRHENFAKTFPELAAALLG